LLGVPRGIQVAAAMTAKAATLSQKCVRLLSSAEPMVFVLRQSLRPRRVGAASVKTSTEYECTPRAELDLSRNREDEALSAAIHL
jgi:hypothetical protein